jgi:Cft2 family RNA processing exonuclease
LTHAQHDHVAPRKLIEVQALAPTENTIEFGKTSMEDSSKKQEKQTFHDYPFAGWDTAFNTGCAI